MGAGGDSSGSGSFPAHSHLQHSSCSIPHRQGPDKDGWYGAPQRTAPILGPGQLTSCEGKTVTKRSLLQMWNISRPYSSQAMMITRPWGGLCPLPLPLPGGPKCAGSQLGCPGRARQLCCWHPMGQGRDSQCRGQGLPGKASVPVLCTSPHGTVPRSKHQAFQHIFPPTAKFPALSLWLLRFRDGYGKGPGAAAPRSRGPRQK